MLKKAKPEEVSEEEIADKIGHNYIAMEVRIGLKGTAVLSKVRDDIDFIKIMMSLENYMKSMAEKINNEDGSELFKKLLSMTPEEREQFLRDAKGLLKGK